MEDWTTEKVQDGRGNFFWLEFRENDKETEVWYMRASTRAREGKLVEVLRKN